MKHYTQIVAEAIADMYEFLDYDFIYEVAWKEYWDYKKIGITLCYDALLSLVMSEIQKRLRIFMEA